MRCCFMNTSSYCKVGLNSRNYSKELLYNSGTIPASHIFIRGERILSDSVNTVSVLRVVTLAVFEYVGTVLYCI